MSCRYKILLEILHQEQLHIFVSRNWQTRRVYRISSGLRGPLLERSQEHILYTYIWFIV